LDVALGGNDSPFATEDLDSPEAPVYDPLIKRKDVALQQHNEALLPSVAARIYHPASGSGLVCFSLAE